MLGTMLNNLYSCATQLEVLWNEISDGWQRSVGAAGGLQATALEHAQQTLRLHAAEVVEYICAWLIFWAMRGEIFCGLYLPSVR